MRKIQLLALLLLVAACPAVASNHYMLQRVTAPYVPLTSDTMVNSITLGSGDLYLFPLKGQSLRFFDKTYLINDSSRFIAFSTNGHLHVEDESSFIIFDGLFHFLDSIDNTSAVSYKMEGTGSGMILKVQWKNLRIRGGAADNFVNFQMWLHRGTGAVELRYGPSSASNANGYSNTTGPYIGMFYSNKVFSVMHEKIWLNGLPATASIDSARDFVFDAMHGVPAEGTLYRFVPKAVATGMASAWTAELQISPNPADDEVIVRVAEAGSVELRDVTGKTLLIKNIQADRPERVSLSIVAPGSYFLHFKTRTGSASRLLMKR